MADVTIAYRGNTIAEMDDSGSKTLKTGGCYCEGDVTVSYTPRTDDTYQHWDVSVSGTISSNYVNILQDNWLKEHRTDSNLCVAVIPKFPITHTSGKGNQGIYLFTNGVIAEADSGTRYKGLSVYVHSNGGIMPRGRPTGVTGGTNICDMDVTSAGVLRVVATADYPVLAGEYCVFAVLM